VAAVPYPDPLYALAGGFRDQGAVCSMRALVVSRSASPLWLELAAPPLPVDSFGAVPAEIAFPP